MLDAAGNIEKKFREETGCVLIEPDFFNVFDFKGTGFKWLSGNPAKALEEPMNAVLTKTMAEKFFPGQDPLGH